MVTCEHTHAFSSTHADMYLHTHFPGLISIQILKQPIPEQGGYSFRLSLSCRASAEEAITYLLLWLDLPSSPQYPQSCILYSVFESHKVAIFAFISLFFPFWILSFISHHYQEYWRPLRTTVISHVLNTLCPITLSNFLHYIYNVLASLVLFHVVVYNIEH